MKEKISSILKGIRPEFDFNENINFISEGMLDSFDIVNLISELEDNFDVMINGVDIIPDNFSSLDSIKELISKSEKRNNEI